MNRIVVEDLVNSGVRIFAVLTGRNDETGDEHVYYFDDKLKAVAFAKNIWSGYMRSEKIENYIHVSQNSVDEIGKVIDYFEK